MADTPQYHFTIALDVDTASPDDFAEELTAIIHANFDGDQRPRVQITHIGRDRFPWRRPT